MTRGHGLLSHHRLARATGALSLVLVACSGRSSDRDRYVVASGGTGAGAAMAGQGGSAGRTDDGAGGRAAGHGGSGSRGGSAGRNDAGGGETTNGGDAGASFGDAGAGDGAGATDGAGAGGRGGTPSPVKGALLYVKASNPDAQDYFGTALALTDDFLAVGAPNESSRAAGIDGDQADDSEDYSGAVYLFSQSAAGWVQAAYVKASNPGAGDGFGDALALDGDTLAVAAPFEDSAARSVDGDETDEDGDNSGAVYVFRTAGGSVRQEAYIKPSNGDPIDLFGTSVALAGDTLIVGAPWEDGASLGGEPAPNDNGADRSGAVYVFARDASGWAERAYLKASNAASLGEFGASVALRGDDLAVGAPGARDSNGLADDRGAVYLFERAGETFTETAIVKPAELTPDDRFGTRVALDGDVLAASAVEDARPNGSGTGDPEALPGAGAVAVFTRDHGLWSESAYLKAPTPQEDGFFGFALALAGDTLYVGAIGEEAQTPYPASGSVYVYVRDANGWVLHDHLLAPNRSDNDRYGSALGVSPAHLAVGAYNEDGASPGIEGDRSNDDAPGSGAVFLYER